MNYVKIPEAMPSDSLSTEIPVYDSTDSQRGFARYYHPHGYRVVLLPDFHAKIRNTEQSRQLITDDSGKIVGIKVMPSNSN